MGTLYYGDNLPILREHLRDESVDLVYLDPPFKSDANYNAFFKGKTGAAASQIKAFEDTWHWVNRDNESMSEFQKLLGDARTPDAVRRLLQAYHDFMGGCDMMAYLMMMAPRLVELKRVLKPTGSLYLHCDPTASHYLKLLLDATFGNNGFRTEIIWKRSAAHSDTKQGRKQHGCIHDVILFYTKADEWKWNPIYTPYDEEYLESEYRHKTKEGRFYKETDLTAAKPGGDVEYDWQVKRPVGSDERWVADLEDEYKNPKKGWEYKAVRPYQRRFWAYSKQNLREFALAGKLIHRETGMPRLVQFADEMPGIPLQDLWSDIPPIGAQAKERLGYPTQKPVALLERILNASSNAGDVVLDPFCGCGTTIDAAEKLDREWIGIDITQVAMTTIKKRLWDTYHETKTVKFLRGSDAVGGASVPASRANPRPTPAREDIRPTKSSAEMIVRIIGEPVTPEDAEAMAKEDPYGFQWWAAGLIGAQGGAEKKKGADSGIDGRIIFFDDPKSATGEEIILQVKGGKLKADDIRALGFVVEREKAAMGVLISVDEPSDKMYADAAAAGYYTHKLTGQKYPKLQLRTVKQLMAGKGIDRPSESTARDETFKKAPKAKSKRDEQMELVTTALRADMTPVLKRLNDILKIKDDAKMKSELEKLLAEWPEIVNEVRKNKNTAKVMEKILGEAFISGLTGKHPWEE